MGVMKAALEKLHLSWHLGDQDSGKSTASRDQQEK
jgi:hypothetical protein